MTGRAPLRFLAVVVGGWVCVRAAVLLPGWRVEAGAAAPAPERAPVVIAAGAGPASQARAPQPLGAMPSGAREPRGTREAVPAIPRASVAPPILLVAAAPPVARAVAPLALLWPEPAPTLRERIGPSRRASGSAWLLLRPDEGGSLAPGGTLGGSQAGVRLTWRFAGDVRHPLALAARLYAPVGRRSAAEAALGVDWRPSRQVPFHFVAERRQALGRDGRSAFALALYGGTSVRLLAGAMRFDAFAQAGVVGARSRDRFADGSARLSMPAGRLEFGAGLWGGAQPGAARLDAGPQVSARLPLARETVRVSAEWRFRIAGEARPGSGPALTVGTDF